MTDTQIFDRALVMKNFHPKIADILALALSSEELFTPTRAHHDGIFDKSSLDRESYRGGAYRSPELKNLLLSTMDILLGHKEKILERFNMKKLYFMSPRVFMTRMGDGDFLVRHHDLHKISGPNFELIVLLYFYSEPKNFSGGELELFWKDGVEVIEPENNMIVIFPAWVEHAVRTVHCPSRKFTDSRFVAVGRFCAPPTMLHQVSRLTRFFTRGACNIKKQLDRSIGRLT